ncbi:MAG: TetR family transcriptional regulator [Acidimicrobiia bacterium]|nr:TetR family transcriptional regulator [Acidimicrobiia bacterium]
MAPSGLRELRAARTRDAIVSAAYALFAERGFHATTVDDIAARAEVAPRTFFRYFPTKERVVFARAPEQRQQLAQALAARPADEHPFTSLAVVISDFAEDLEGHRKEMRLRKKIAAECPDIWAYERAVFEADMTQTLSGFVAERLHTTGDADLRPQVWAAIVMSALRIAMHHWLEHGQHGSVRPLVERALADAAESAAYTPVGATT